MNCSVCGKKNVLQCTYCSYPACASCIERYLLETVHDAHCMSCRKEWSHEWLRDHLSASFIQLYRNRTEQLLFQKECYLLPQTQPIVHLHQHLNQYDQSLHELYKKIKYFQDQITEIQIHKDNIKKELCHQKRDSYSFSCPYQGCKGYVNSNHHCGLCLRKVCITCREIFDMDHQCNQDTIISLKSINQDSKPCPKCSTYIYKVSGCDHMWCVQCHTHFHWNTLAIEKGILHNPHYYEYLSTHSISSIQELGRIDKKELQRKLNLLLISIEDQEKILHFIDQMITIRECIYPIIPTQNDSLNEDLRIQFLQNELSENEFKSSLYKRYKHHLGYTSYRNILDTYFRIMAEKISNPTITFIQDYQELCNTLNQKIIQLKKNYKFSFKLIPTSA